MKKFNLKERYNDKKETYQAIIEDEELSKMLKKEIIKGAVTGLVSGLAVVGLTILVEALKELDNQ